MTQSEQLIFNKQYCGMETIFNTANVSQNVRDALKAKGIGLNHFLQIIQTPGNKQSIREQFFQEYGLHQSKFIIICEQLEFKYLKNSSQMTKPKLPSTGLAQIQKSSFNTSQPQAQLKSGNKRLSMLLGSASKSAQPVNNIQSNNASPSLSNVTSSSLAHVSSKIPQLRPISSLQQTATAKPYPNLNPDNNSSCTVAIKSPPQAEIFMSDLLRDSVTTMPESRLLTNEGPKERHLHQPPNSPQQEGAPAHFDAGNFTLEDHHMNDNEQQYNMVENSKNIAISGEVRGINGQEAQRNTYLARNHGMAQALEVAVESSNFIQEEEKNKEVVSLIRVGQEIIDQDQSNVNDLNVETLSEDVLSLKDQEEEEEEEPPAVNKENKYEDAQQISMSVGNEAKTQQTVTIVEDQLVVIPERYQLVEQQIIDQSLQSSSSSDSLSSSFTESELGDQEYQQPTILPVANHELSDDSHSEQQISYSFAKQNLIINELNPADKMHKNHEDRDQLNAAKLDDDEIMLLLDEQKEEAHIQVSDPHSAAQDKLLPNAGSVTDTLLEEKAEIVQRRFRDIECQCDPWIPEVVYRDPPKKVMKNKKLSVTMDKIDRCIQGPQKKKDSETQVLTELNQTQEYSIELSQPLQTSSIKPPTQQLVNLGKSISLPKIAQEHYHQRESSQQQAFSFSGLPYLSQPRIQQQSDAFETRSQRLEPLRSILKNKPDQKSPLQQQNQEQEESSSYNFAFDDEVFTEFSYFTQQYQPPTKRVKFDPIIEEREKRKIREQKMLAQQRELQRKRLLNAQGKKCLYDDINEFAPNAAVNDYGDRQRKRLRCMVREEVEESDQECNQEEEGEEEGDEEMESDREEGEEEQEYDEDGEEEFEEEQSEEEEQSFEPPRPSKRATVAMKEPKRVIQTTQKQLKDEINAKNIKVQSDDDQGSDINCDKMLFKQRLMNFMSTFKK